MKVTLSDVLNLLSPKVIILDSWSVYHRFRFANLLKLFRHSVAKSLLLCPYSKKEKNFFTFSLTIHLEFRKINSLEKKSLIIYYVPDDSSRLGAVNKIYF